MKFGMLTWIGFAEHVSGADAPVDTTVLLAAPGDARHVPEVDAFKGFVHCYRDMHLIKESPFKM